MAGDRAEAFIRNPFAVLGPEAAEVIDPDAFEEAREDAGISFATFTASALRDANGFPYEVSILVEETIRGETTVERVKTAAVLAGVSQTMRARSLAFALMPAWIPDGIGFTGMVTARTELVEEVFGFEARPLTPE